MEKNFDMTKGMVIVSCLYGSYLAMCDKIDQKPTRVNQINSMVTLLLPLVLT